MPQLFPVPSPPGVPATSPGDRRLPATRGNLRQHSGSGTAQTDTDSTHRVRAVATPISHSQSQSQFHSDYDNPTIPRDGTPEAHHVHFSSPPSHPPRQWTRPSPSPYVSPPPKDLLPVQLDLEKQNGSTESDPPSVPSSSGEEFPQEQLEGTVRAIQRYYYVVPGFGWRIRRVYVWVLAGLGIIALPAAIGLSQI